jgi:hypothetical protein
VLVRSYANSRAWVPYPRQPGSERQAARLVRELRQEGRDVVLRRELAGVTRLEQFAAVPLS